MRRWIAAHVVVSSLAAVLCFVPLTQVLGFEFAVTLGAALAVVSGWTALAYAVDARRAVAAAGTTASQRDEASGGFPGAFLIRTLLGNLALLPLPIVLLSLNALRIPNCDWWEGLRFTLVIGVPGVLYGSALGFLIGLRFDPRGGRLLFVTWILATILWALWNVVRQPPIFAFNAVVAWFPGPVYDRIVSLDERLLVARSLVVLEAVVFLCVSVVLWNGRRLQVAAIRHATAGGRAVPLVIGAVCLAMFLLAQGHADRLGLRLDRSFIQQQLGGRIETTHCTIFYDERSYPPQRARELAAEHEFHYAELRNWFGVEPDRRIRSYVYASAHQKKRLMGAAGTNFEDALNDEFHINAAGFPHPVLRHEMAHIFAAHIDDWWPVCPLMGIHEGLAVAADWRQESSDIGMTPDEACVAMQRLGVLPDLQRTLSAFGFWTQASARAYTVSGSFLHYLIDEYGMPALRRLWSSRDFEATYGRPLETLIGEWQQRRLDPVRLSARQMRLAERRYLRHSVFREPCAHEQAQLRRDAAVALSVQPRAADSLYSRLIDIAPQETAPWFGRLRALLRQGNAEAALQLGEEMRQRLRLRGSDSTLVWRYAGDAHWLRDDFAAADSCYGVALDTAARRPTRRALQVNHAVLQSPILRQLLRGYLVESVQDDTASLTLLATARARVPESPWPAYLLGRRSYYAHRFAETIATLQPLLDVPLPEDVRLATIELVAWALLRQGDAAACLRVVDNATDEAWSSAERLRLEDLRRRAEASQEGLAAIFPGTFSPEVRF